MSNDMNTPGNSETQPQKKPYHQPKLITYGDVREITKNAGGVVGANDGGGGKDKTG